MHINTKNPYLNDIVYSTKNPYNLNDIVVYVPCHMHQVAFPLSNNNGVIFNSGIAVWLNEKFRKF